MWKALEKKAYKQVSCGPMEINCLAVSRGHNFRALTGCAIITAQSDKLPTVWRFALCVLNLMALLPHCHKYSSALLLCHTNTAAGHLSRHTQIALATNGLATHAHTQTDVCIHIKRF